MESSLILSSAPHIHTKDTSRRIMLDVIIALLPAVVASVVIFGVKALGIIAACVIAAVVSEAVFDLIVGKKQTVGDLSAVVTGLLLALNLSTNVAIWQCVVGSVFAIVVVKCLFGGLGKNFANPAITGRVFMLLAFSSVAGGANPVIVELTTTATPLELIAQQAENAPTLMELFLGLHGGAIGETCCLALLIGFAYLLVRKVIKWHVPVIFIATVFVCYLIATGDFTYALSEILAGGLFIGAIFMATDYVTSPITLKGKMVFALGCGLVTFVIRYFCAYPEGVSFSILAMNILTPYIEKWTANTPLGGSKNG
ncbi:MAG TPA: RnfABCDGE type electron transport complex subunit D [Candidatus Limivicinus faecipullorum]|nr:RnfABCDGE type electron transport complex subunit D [Candidatus Limivicinus faecipullorum]